MNIIQRLAVILSVSIITACGGGGGTKPNNPPTGDVTCAQKIGVSPYVNSSNDGPSSTDSTCPAGQTLVTSGISFTRTTVTYSCSNPSSTTQNPTSSSSSSTVVSQQKVCQTSTPVACANVSGSSNQYACRTGFDKVNADGKTGAGITMGAIEPGITLNSQGISGAPVEFYAGGGSNDPTYAYHGSGVANIILGDKNIVPNSQGVANSNIGGLLPDLSKLIVSPGVSYGILDNFYNNGVKVINWSGGVDVAYGESGDLVAAQQFMPYWARARDLGMILVMSAGNESKINPSVTASLPSFDQSLINSTITAVSADPATLGNASSAVLASYSNRCGVAADYCLTAPGTVWIPSETTTGAGRSFSGTSIAAPIISSSAALTWNEFPFMSAWQLRETLFTTATDLGVTGVDTTFGHGLVNVEKSIKGPGELRSNWNVNIGGGSYTFANDIKGAGGLIKDGNGKLSISGNNTFTGGINVLDGELALNGSNNVSSASVAFGGAMSGNGSVNSLTNDGVVEVANGNLSVNGNFSQSSGGTLVVEVNRSLTVNGSANVAGAFNLKVPDSYVVSGSINPAITTTNGLNGTFSSTASTSPLFSLMATYTANNLNVALTRLTAMSVIAPTSMSDVSDAKRLDDMFDVIDNAVKNGETVSALSAAAAIQGSESVEQLSVAAKSLSGRAYSDQIGLAVNSDAFERKRAETRLKNNQDGVINVSFIGDAQAFGGQSAVSSGYRADMTGELASGTRVGAFMTDINGYNGGQFDGSESETKRFDVIVDKRLNDKTSFISSVSFANSKISTERQLMLSKLNESAFGEQDVSISTARAGISSNVGGVKFNTGVSVSYMKSSSVNELGKTGLELAVKSKSETYAIIDGGVSKSFNFEKGEWSNSLTISADVGYNTGGNISSLSSMYSGLDFEFSIDSQDESKFYNTIGAAFSANNDDGSMINFDFSISPNDHSRDAFTFSFIKSF